MADWGCGVLPVPSGYRGPAVIPAPASSGPVVFPKTLFKKLELWKIDVDAGGATIDDADAGGATINDEDAGA